MTELKGILGATLTLIMPFLNFLSIALQIIGALFGLYLLVISIHNKKLEKKKLNLEIKNLQKPHKNDKIH